MTQAFYNAISGINANQSQLVVVSDNIANMNTIGFKGSRVTFSDIYYNTLSSGSAPTRTMGGTNGKQIGAGVQIASIDKDFTNGTVNSTGITTDCNIQGNGFFVVQSATGEALCTRAGNFTIDSEGYLTLPSGYRLVGATDEFSMSRSTSALKIPNMISTETIANTTDIQTKKLQDLNACAISKGDFTITVNKKDGTVASATVVLNESDKTLNNVMTKLTNAVGGITEDVTVTLADGKISFTMADGGEVESMDFASGSSNFVVTTELRREGSLSNVYSTKVLDYKQLVNAPDSVEAAQKYSSISIGENGVVEITYSNGDKLSVFANDIGMNEFLYTTSEGIIIKGDSDVLVSDAVLPEANLQFQLVNYMNPNGLLSAGSNLFKPGPNAGTAFYGTGNSNAFGTIKTGGYEASNVDLSSEFASMITAQRAIEANSRVFGTTNEIMKTLVYLGS